MLDKRNNETDNSNKENKMNGGENIDALKKNPVQYTADQLNDAERFMKIMASIPENKRPIFRMVVNAFISGLEARKELEEEYSSDSK